MVAQQTSAKAKPAPNAALQADSESEDDVDVAPVNANGGHAEQSFLDEVLEANRSIDAPGHSDTGGKQRPKDRSGVVKVIDVKRKQASEKSRPSHNQGRQGKTRKGASKAGPNAAVRGASAAQLLVRDDWRTAVAAGAHASAWD